MTRIFYIVLSLFVFNVSFSQDQIYGSHNNLNYFYDSGIYVHADSIMVLVGDCYEVFRTSVEINANGYKNTYSSKYGEGDNAEYEENQIFSDGKLFEIESHEENLQMAKYHDEYGDLYVLVKYLSENNKTISHFWRSRRGHYYMYQLFSDKCLDKEQVVTELRRYLDRKLGDEFSYQIVPRDAAGEKPVQAFMRKSMGIKKR